VKYYKILVNGKSCNGGKAEWLLPSKSRPGKWMPKIEGELKLCEREYHIVKAEDILVWVKEGCGIYEVEPKGEVIYGDSKGICRTVRLTKCLKWDDKIARSFACDCAERVLPIFEKQYPKDKRPRICIETARKFIFGLATEGELDDAWDAAGAAAWDAAGAAAWDAGAAARDARDTAGAAWAAAGGGWAAGDAGAARAAEKKWQTTRLLKYLNGRVVPKK